MRKVFKIAFLIRKYTNFAELIHKEKSKANKNKALRFSEDPEQPENE